MRHNFATHLVESGTDFQGLLGYKGSKTTEIYTHVSERDIGGIKNPLNTIGKGGNMRLKYGINELFDYFKLCERAVLKY